MGEGEDGGVAPFGDRTASASILFTCLGRHAFEQVGGADQGPSRTTSSIDRVWRMSSSGFAVSSTMSASLPGAMAQSLLLPQHRGVVQGGGTQRGGRRQARLDQHLQFLMQREAGRHLRLGRVGSDQQRHAGAIELAGQLLKLGELAAAIFQRAPLRAAGSFAGRPARSRAAAAGPRALSG